MSFTTVDVTVRPIKLAILVDYNDDVALRKAILINSVLWGGLFNPIIPVYKRLPRSLLDVRGYKFSKKEDITKGYLDAFDADYILSLSKTPAERFGVNQWRT